MKTLNLYAKIVSLSVLLLGASAQASVVYFALPSGLQNPTGLAEGPDGNIYGTAGNGGVNNAGAVFRMTPDGQFTLVAPFNGTNGSYPTYGLTLANGNFYGITLIGGANGVGTVFKATLAGDLKALYSFDHSGDSGIGLLPSGRLLLGRDGNLYGSTMYSSDNSPGGSIFKVSASGVVTVFSAPGGASGLVQDADGNLWGANWSSQAFRVSPDGTYSVVAQVPGSPLKGLIIGTDGNFYGAGIVGGNLDQGCVFRLSPAGNVTVIGSFDDPATGINPTCLLQGDDGNFYGSTMFGGQNNRGCVFQMTPGGQITPVFSFTTTNAMGAPLVKTADGNIYGASGDPVPSPMMATRAAARSGFVFSLRPHVYPTGKYNGLFAETNTSGDTVVNVATAGMIKNMNVNKSGVFNGKLLLAGGTYPFGGTLDADGNASVTVPTANGSLVVTIALDSITGVIKGSVAESTGKWIASLRANRGLTSAPKAHYTMLIPSADPSGVSAPPGAGYETINNANGMVSFAGAVADGTAANLAGIPIAENGDVPLYVSLYHGQGVLLGWINFSSKPSGVVSWIKNGNATTTTYAAGFTNRDLMVSISPWVKPATGAVALPVVNATLTVVGNDLGTLTYTVNGVNPNGSCLQTTASNTANTMKAAIVPATGALTVQIKSGSKITVARGVVLQNTETAGGAYVKSGQAGSFTLTP